MNHIVPLKQVDIRKIKAQKIPGIARIAKLNIPTVPNPYVVLPEAFEEFYKKGKISSSLEKDLENAHALITRDGNTASIRPAIYAPRNPNLDFIENSINIPSFKSFISDFEDRFIQIKDGIEALENVQVSVLLQTFYNSKKCGVIHTEDGNGNVHIEAAFGQHSNIITKCIVSPDVYDINKDSKEIVQEKIEKKEFTYVLDKHGIKRVKLSQKESTTPVFDKQEIMTYFDYAIKLEKAYGPQECEIAKVIDGKLIIQEVRNLTKYKALRNGRSVINLDNDFIGTIVNIGKEKELKKKGDIVLTRNLNVDFITKMAFSRRPKAVIVTKGSITAHAITILRELGIPVIIDRNARFKDKEKIKLHKDGKIIRY